MKFGYARVSTGDQTLSIAAQKEKLDELGCRKVFTDRISGVRSDRPGLRDALEILRPGDVLMVTRLDRLGRSAVDTIRTINDLRQQGIEVNALDVGLDTSTVNGKMVLGVLAVLAEWERDLISERTKIGVAKARAEGRLPGRKPLLSIDQQEIVRAERAKGRSVVSLAAAFNVSEMTIRRALQAAETSDAIADTTGS